MSTLKSQLAFAQPSGETSFDLGNDTSTPTSPVSPSGQDAEGNQTATTNDVASYSNPNLGYSIEYPSTWQKEESLAFISPPTSPSDRSPEIVTITTELLPASDFGLDSYSEAALSQVETFQDFNLLNSSSITLGGLPAHMIVYSFTDQNQTPLQNLQAWTVKDGMAYVITYGGIPEEFQSSLPALQNIMDSFRFE